MEMEFKKEGKLRKEISGKLDLMEERLVSFEESVHKMKELIAMDKDGNASEANIALSTRTLETSRSLGISGSALSLVEVRKLKSIARKSSITRKMRTLY